MVFKDDGYRRLELTRDLAESTMLAELIRSGGFVVALEPQEISAAASALPVGPHRLLVRAEDEAEIRAAIHEFRTVPGNFETVDDIEDLIHDDVEGDVIE